MTSDDTQASESTPVPESGRRYLFRPEQRIRSSRDFTRVYDRKVKGADGVLLMFVDRSPTGVSRLGLSVSKKKGNAPRRARFKRLLREAFRLAQYDVPTGLDMVCVPLADVSTPFHVFQQSLVSLARRLARRLRSANG